MVVNLDTKTKCFLALWVLLSYYFIACAGDANHTTTKRPPRTTFQQIQFMLPFLIGIAVCATTILLCYFLPCCRVYKYRKNLLLEQQGKRLDENPSGNVNAAGVGDLGPTSSEKLNTISSSNELAA